MNTAIDQAMRALRDADPTTDDDVTAAHPGVLSIIDSATNTAATDIADARRPRSRRAPSIVAAAACVAVLATPGLAPGAAHRSANHQPPRHLIGAAGSSTVTAPRVEFRVGDLTDPSAFRAAAAARGLRVTVKVDTRKVIGIPLFPGKPSTCRPDERYPEWTRVGTAVTFPKEGPAPTDGSIGGVMHIVLVNLPRTVLSDPHATLFWLTSTPVPITVTILGGSDLTVAISAPTSYCIVP